jgi:hypothetical protein
MKIETSLDWGEVGGELTRQLNKLPYNQDLRKVINNIDHMIVDLSKAEVEARRINKPQYTKEKVDAVNKAIDHLEKLILIATLVA